MNPPDGKVRPGHRHEDGLQTGVTRLAAQLDGGNDGVDHFAQVVRGHVRRHADRDTRRSVHEEVGKARGEDGGLFGALVVVGDEVDGLLVEVRHHRFGDRFRTRLGVSHGRRRIAVDRSEVPLAVHQGIAHVEILREAHERVVDRRVAVGMVVPHHLADDLRALAIRTIRREAHRPHAVEHATMRRLEPIADVRQRSPDDYAHRVIHVRALHLVFDVDGNFGGCDVGHSDREVLRVLRVANGAQGAGVLRCGARPSAPIVCWCQYRPFSTSSTLGTSTSAIPRLFTFRCPGS